MASIIDDPNGRKRILFIGRDGKRRPLRLGKTTMKQAETWKVYIEDLIGGSYAGGLQDKTRHWLEGLDDKMHARLDAVGLVEPRSQATTTTLSAFITEYLAKIGQKIKPNTLKNYTQAGDCLLEFFGEAKQLRSITAKDGDDWQHWMLTGRTVKLSKATVSKWTVIARQMFKRAIRWGMLTVNPFADLEAGKQTNRARMQFISRNETQKVIDQMPDAQWRLLFALSRYGGLRCPSEHLALKWEDVNFTAGTVLVHSPKTEHHEGGESRLMPMFPELRPYLEDAYAAAERPLPGDYVITRYRQRNCNLRTQLCRFIKRAGLKPWPRLFHNLRSTRQTELEETFPTHVVCAWLGNTPDVARKNYLQVTEGHFAKALVGHVDRQAKSHDAILKAAHNQAQSAADLRGQQRTRGDANRDAERKPALCAANGVDGRSPQESNL